MANHKEVKAFEIKLAQGAKTRGGHMEAIKLQKKLLKFVISNPIRQSIHLTASDFINNPKELLEFVAKLQKLGQKPVDLKLW